MRNRSRHLVGTVLLGALVVAFAGEAQAQSFSGFGAYNTYTPLPGGGYTYHYQYGLRLCDDGSAVMGYDYTLTYIPTPYSYTYEYRPWRWTESAGLVYLPRVIPAGTSNYQISYPVGISSDGRVMAGYSYYFDQGMGTYVYASWRWTEAGGMAVLPNPPGWSYTIAQLLSKDGAVVVGYGYNGARYTYWRWTQSTGVVDFGAPPGAPPSGYFHPQLISEDSRVVIGRSSWDSQYWRWTTTGGYESLGTLPGATYPGIYVRALSADGDVVVGQGYDAAGNYVTWRWTKQSGMVAIPRLPNAYTSGAYVYPEYFVAMSRDGSAITGYQYVVDGTTYGYEGWIWREGTGLVGFGFVPGATYNYSIPSAISGDGQVVTGYTYMPSGYRTFVWRDGPGMELLETSAPGVAYSFPSVISDDGRTIGGREYGPTGYGAFVWREGEGSRLLHDILVTDGGVDLTGWTLYYPTQISRDGTALFGYGAGPDGSQYWIAHLGASATPPANRPPEFRPPTPADKSLEITRFDVRVVDPDGDPVTVKVGGLPAGATTTPSLPYTGNPVDIHFLWTPVPGDEGIHTVTFTATDSQGNASECVFDLLIDFKDTDGDGLPNLWETSGYTHGSGTYVDLPAMGADPNVPDIFVHVDYMKDPMVDHRPMQQALDLVVAGFASRGIKLHVFVDEPLPLLDVLGTVSAGKYNWAAFDSLKAAHFPAELSPMAHYCIFAHRIATGDSGISRGNGAADFIVSLADFTNGVGSIQQQSGTFMHELGHDLGLRHGGGDNLNYKPNYLSVMNYAFQHSGLRRGGANGVFDFSGSSVDIDERNLTEGGGLGLLLLTGYGTTWYCAGKQQFVESVVQDIDWNCDGVIASGVSVDTNRDGFPLLLRGFNDWSNIIYKGGAIGGFGAPPPPPEETELKELDIVEALTIKPAPPTGLSARAARGAVRLSWTPTGPTGEYTYNLYRAPHGGTLAKVASTTSAAYMDRPLATGTYDYALSLVNALGVESTITPSVAVAVP